MKILYVTHEGKMGGASKSLVSLADQMAQKGHEVTVLTPFERGELIDELKKHPNIKIIASFYTWWQYPSRASKSQQVAFIIGYRTNILAKYKIRKILKNQTFDIVHTNSSVVDIGAYISKLVHAKHIWHFREFGETDMGLKFIRGKERSLEYVNKHADKIIFISKAIENAYKTWISETHRVVIYNGVDTNYLYKKNETDYFQNNQVNFLIAGALQEGKGQEKVIEAARILVDRNIDEFHISIAGRNINQYQRKLENMVQEYHLEDKIDFVGMITNMKEYRKCQDVELICSKSEAFGRVTIEAMMASNPVIASNSGANPELVQNNKNGLLFSVDNVEELADCMKQLIFDRQIILEMGSNAYLYTKNNFSAKKNADEIEQLYSEIVTDLSANKS